MTKVKLNSFCCRARFSVLVLTIVASSMTLAVVSGETVGLPRDCALNQVKGNPHDPHTFFWCLSEGPVLMKCVDGHVFDVAANKCISEKAQQQQKRKQKKEEKSSIKKGKPSNVVSSPPAPVKCPPHIYDGSKADTSIYMADPHRCSSFYQCSHGEAYLHNCPDGLLFNPELNVCDHSVNVRTCVDKQQQQQVKATSLLSSSKSHQKNSQPLRLVI